MSEARVLADHLILGLRLTKRCANGCGTSLSNEQARRRPALCDRCAAITATGWRGCSDCGREWTGLREAHCVECHRQFSSDSAFDLHWGIDHTPCAERPENQGGKHKVCYARSTHRDPAVIRKQDGPPRLIEVQTDHGPVWSWPGARPAEINRSTS